MGSVATVATVVSVVLPVRAVMAAMVPRVTGSTRVRAANTGLAATAVKPVVMARSDKVVLAARPAVMMPRRAQPEPRAAACPRKVATAVTAVRAQTRTQITPTAARAAT